MVSKVTTIGNTVPTTVLYEAWSNSNHSSFNGECATSHLPSKPVALGVVEPEVRHFAVVDVHPSFPHLVLGPTVAILVVVGDDLREDADKRATIVFVFVDGVVVGVPCENLNRKGDGKGLLKIKQHSTRGWEPKPSQS